MSEERCETCKFWKETLVPGSIQQDHERLAKLAEENGETIEEVKERYDEIDEECGHEGICQRFPPVPLIWERELESRQPHTDADEWCGEWRGLHTVAP